MSDFGVTNTDGTDRPISKVIREEGAKLLTDTKTWKPDVLVPITRQNPRGIVGIYDETKEAFWDAINKGQTPGLKWAN
jgi:hypothetical protein